MKKRKKEKILPEETYLSTTLCVSVCVSDRLLVNKKRNFLSILEKNEKEVNDIHEEEEGEELVW